MKTLNKLVEKWDALMNYNQLDNPANPEVRKFIENHLMLVFEIDQYKRTAPNQMIDIALCQTIVSRIECMNEFLLFYQSEMDTFESVQTLRAGFHMEEHLLLKADLQQQLLAIEQQQQSQQQQPQTPPWMTTPYPMPAPPSNSYVINLNEA